MFESFDRTLFCVWFAMVVRVVVGFDVVSNGVKLFSLSVFFHEFLILYLRLYLVWVFQ